ncbi:ribonuclease Y [bacterium]|nr:ribonuclease Y [bacterium]
MVQLFLLLVGIIALGIGAVLGYYTRQTIAKKDKESLESIVQKKIASAKSEAEKILVRAKSKAEKVLRDAQEESDVRRKELFKTEKILLQREDILDKKISLFERKEREFANKVARLRAVKEEVEKLKKEAEEKLEAISGLSREEAKGKLLKDIESEHKKEIFERIQKLNHEGDEKFERRAKEILSQVIQSYAQSQAQELTTTTVNLPSEEIKGRIIGKEGRNIKAFERLTGIEVIVDDTPGTVIISGFNPLRREIARIALEKLLRDGRIQPARIEETVEKAKAEVKERIKKAGTEAVYEVGIVDLSPELVELLGRLYFRTSFGQNVLLHSIEVAHLSSALAEELGARADIAKKAGLLHDIGKAIDQQVEGSHVNIGIKILEKFGVEQAVIDAMKSHHDEYPPKSIEAIIVKVADQISGARPGARKDTLENYLKRLKDLEDIALSFRGVSQAYAIKAGREIRVFVRPEEVDDLEAYKLARDIAKKIQSELNYPGEIKVTVIRETRVIEYAK